MRLSVEEISIHKTAKQEASVEGGRKALGELIGTAADRQVTPSAWARSTSVATVSVIPNWFQSLLGWRP